MKTSAEGRIESINVGTPREIVRYGRPTTTAIWKEPVEGPVRILAQSVAGDHQADPTVHGGPRKSVYAYSVEDYAWWSEELGRRLGPGTFGENLTTSGLDLNALRIGEEVRAGTALLRVTQPRFPCWKLGARMGSPQFPRRFLKAARAGAYFEVVEQGLVAAGEGIASAAVPSPPVTLGLIAHLNHADRKLAQLLLQAAFAKLDPAAWDELLAMIQIPA